MLVSYARFNTVLAGGLLSVRTHGGSVQAARHRTQFQSFHETSGLLALRKRLL